MSVAVEDREEERGVAEAVVAVEVAVATTSSRRPTTPWPR